MTTLIHPIKRELIRLSASEATFIEAWLTTNINNSSCRFIDEKLPMPKWHFLTYLCDHLGVLAHGSDRANLEELIPVAKQRGDLSVFGNATQIFASPDALWAMWFALMNRQMKFVGTANSCTRHVDDNGRVHKRYWFGLAHESITDSQPLADGMIYLLRPDQFLGKNGEEWGSKETVIPFAKLAVSPTDWPFRHDILGFDRELLWQKLEESADLFPYFDDDKLWKIIPDSYRTETWLGQ